MIPGPLYARLLAGLPEFSGRIALQIGGKRWTYADLHADAHRLAMRLRPAADRVTDQTRIGILAPAGSYSAYVGLLATVYAGSVAVPLHASYPADRLAAIAVQAGLDVILVDDVAVAAADRLAVALTGISTIRVAEALGAPADAGISAPGQPPGRDATCEKIATGDPDTLAYLMFTSGSTGRPKGVPISHGNVEHFLGAAQDRHRIGPDDVLAQTFEPTFDLFMFAPLIAWSVGAQVVALPSRALLRLADFLNAHEVTVWFSVPSMIRLAQRVGALVPDSLPTLRTSLFCGEALTVTDAAAWHAAAPKAAVHNLYGPTELTIACTADVWRPDDVVPPTNGTVPIGQLHSGLVHVLLDEQLRPVDDEGELCVAGPQMMRGYLDPADDVGRFATVAGRRYYRTGDRVLRLGDGRLTYLGRLDHQVKVRGYRVELLEVEHELRRLPGVTECAAAVLTEDGESSLHAAYVGDPGAGSGLLAMLAVRLPEYMVPRTVRHTDQLPINGNGKVDRVALASTLAADAAGV